MKASYFKHILNFNQPSGTSRGILTFKETWFLKIEDENNFGIGECSMLRGLSIDDRFDFEEKLNWVCENINLDLNHLDNFQFDIIDALAKTKSTDPTFTVLFLVFWLF